MWMQTQWREWERILKQTYGSRCFAAASNDYQWSNLMAVVSYLLGAACCSVTIETTIHPFICCSFVLLETCSDQRRYVTRALDIFRGAPNISTQCRSTFQTQILKLTYELVLILRLQVHSLVQFDTINLGDLAVAESSSIHPLFMAAVLTFFGLLDVWIPLMFLIVSVAVCLWTSSLSFPLLLAMVVQLDLCSTSRAA